MTKPMELVDDPDLGQVKWERGDGIITNIERRQTNKRVDIEVRGLKFPVKGWTSGDDEATNAFAEVAAEAGQRVRFVVRTRRKPDVDKDLPLDKVDKFDKIAELMVLEPWSGEANQDQAQNGPSGATRPQEAPQAPTTPESPPQEGDAADGDYGDTAPPPEAAPPEDTTSTDQRRPKIAEGKAWEAVNSDGSLNLGSYAYQAAVGMVDRAFDLILDYRRRQATDVVDLATLVKPAQVKTLARKLLEAADRIQSTMRGDGRIDRMANSHVRARGAVHTALDLYPPPFDAGGDADAIGTWVENLVRTGVELLGVAYDLTREEV